jgi:hypothetical protein
MSMLLTGTGVGDVEWTPLALGSDLVAWWDVSDISTLFQDSGGSTPITATGQLVGLILDKSGNGWHLRQSTSASRPAYNAEASLSWVAGNEASRFLACSATYSNIGNLTLVTAASLDGTANFGRIVDGNFTTGFWTGRNLSLSQVGGGIIESVDPYGTFFSLANNTPAVLSMVRTGGSTSCALNKGAPSSRTTSSSLATGKFGMCGSNVAGFCSSHKIYGAVVVKTAVDAVTLNNLVTYLGKKAGLSL